MKKTLTWSAIVLLAVAGCQQDKVSQKEQAAKQWKSARAGVLAGLARDQYHNGNLDKSRQTLDEALRLDPKNPALHVLSAKLAIEQGQLELADKELKSARELDAKNAEIDYLSGIIYQRWQRLQEAQDFYADAVQKNPNELAYPLAQAEMLVALDKSDDALALLQSKTAKFEHSAPLYDAIGQLLMQKHKYADAADILRKAMLLDTEDNSIREHFAQALYRAGRYPQTIDTLSWLMKNERYAGRADLYVTLGDCRIRLGKLREARADFERALQLNPKQAIAWMNLARISLELNDLDRADRDLKRAIALEPGASEGYLLLGYLHLRQNRLKDALADFRKSSALDPKDSVSLSMIGYVLEKQGHANQAANYYGQALKSDPHDELASHLLAGVDLAE
jgi:superkiller protein 3